MRMAVVTSSKCAITPSADRNGWDAFVCWKIPMATAAILAGADSIRDVIAFPKTQKGICLMTNAPSDVDSKQLKELHIKKSEA